MEVPWICPCVHATFSPTSLSNLCCKQHWAEQELLTVSTGVASLSPWFPVQQPRSVPPLATASASAFRHPDGALLSHWYVACRPGTCRVQDVGDYDRYSRISPTGSGRRQLRGAAINERSPVLRLGTCAFRSCLLRS